MMRIAIAGTNGFAQYLCHYLQEETPHQFMLLSRRPNAGLAAKGWQVVQANYDNFDELKYLLIGVDIVISTISGTAQITLIDAAAAAHVKSFVPSEFRGPPSKRRKDDPSDNGRSAALNKLAHLQSQNQLSFTVFTCGIFYERFAPGGLGASQIDPSHALGAEGDFIANIRKAYATLPVAEGLNPRQTPSEETYICMTSSRDAARSVVAAMGLSYWPKEFHIRGERFSLREVVALCEKVRGMPFRIEPQTLTSLQELTSFACVSGQKDLEIRASQHFSAFEGAFDFTETNLSDLVNISCERFEDWLRDTWRPVLSTPPIQDSGGG